MKILVTGATGFLGKAVALHLHQHGHCVTGTGRDIQQGKALEQSGVHFLPADLADQRGLPALCRGQEAIVHCAAFSSPWGAASEFQRCNVVATQNLLREAVRNSVARLVHISTPSIYFQFRHQLGLTEDSPLPRRSVNAYARTKREAEQIVARAAGELPVLILRPRAIFGPGDTAIFPRLLRAGAGGRLPILGDGENLADLTYIDCAVAAVSRALQAPEDCCGQAYNITNGEPVKLWTFIGEVFQRLGLRVPRRRVALPLALAGARLSEVWGCMVRTEPKLTRYGVGALGYSQTFDIDRARNRLGYAPPVSLAEGLNRFIHWHQSTHGSRT